MRQYELLRRVSCPRLQHLAGGQTDNLRPPFESICLLTDWSQ
jgi:hypothetical protein